MAWPDWSALKTYALYSIISESQIAKTAGKTIEVVDAGTSTIVVGVSQGAGGGKLCG